MYTQPTNPFASPSSLADASERIHWTALIPVKLLLWAALCFGLMVGVLIAGYFHYQFLAAGFNYETGASRELSQLTNTAFYWLIPAIALLAVWLLLTLAAIALFVTRWIRSL